MQASAEDNGVVPTFTPSTDPLPEPEWLIEPVEATIAMALTSTNSSSFCREWRQEI